MHCSCGFSKGLVFEDLKIQLGKLSEAEKIFEYLNDSSSESAQSESVAFLLAERLNQAVIKQILGQNVSTS